MFGFVATASGRTAWGLPLMGGELATASHAAVQQTAWMRWGAGLGGARVFIGRRSQPIADSHPTKFRHDAPYATAPPAASRHRAAYASPTWSRIPSVGPCPQLGRSRYSFNFGLLQPRRLECVVLWGNEPEIRMLRSHRYETASLRNIGFVGRRRHAVDDKGRRERVKREAHAEPKRSGLRTVRRGFVPGPSSGQIRARRKSGT